MVTNSQERKWRIMECLKKISKVETPKKNVIGKIMIDWGVSKRVAVEYLDSLVAGDFVREGAGKIWRNL